MIVDEEHENSFKQADSAPRYHGEIWPSCSRPSARQTLLGSATPSVESDFNAATGKYGLVTLAERYGGAVLPRVIVSDTLRAAKRGEKRSHFNKALLDRIGEALQAGSQAILFQNRRGFSPYVECGHCGWTANCPDCNVSLTYHKSDGSLRCHYCGYRIPVPAVCPSCGTGSWPPRGFQPRNRAGNSPPFSPKPRSTGSTPIRRSRRADTAGSWRRSSRGGPTF